MRNFHIALSSFFVAASVMILSSTVIAADQEPVEQEITLRILGGVSFLSNTDPVVGGFSLGSDIKFGITDKFGIGATFAHTLGSGSTSNPGTRVNQDITVIGVNPYYGLRKSSGVSASVGIIAGAMISATSTTLNASPGGTTSGSASKFALGLNAAIDIPVMGAFFFTLVPEYVHSIGSGENIGVASIRGGFGFSL